MRFFFTGWEGGGRIAVCLLLLFTWPGEWRIRSSTKSPCRNERKRPMLSMKRMPKMKYGPSGGRVRQSCDFQTQQLRLRQQYHHLNKNEKTNRGSPLFLFRVDLVRLLRWFSLFSTFRLLPPPSSLYIRHFFLSSFFIVVENRFPPKSDGVTSALTRKLTHVAMILSVRDAHDNTAQTQSG